jgi:hypothetical protein
MGVFCCKINLRKQIAGKNAYSFDAALRLTINSVRYATVVKSHCSSILLDDYGKTLRGTVQGGCSKNIFRIKNNILGNDLYNQG